MHKHLNKMVRHEAAVLNDTDIEELHQMRIGLRRLRTTIQTFEAVLALPDTIQDDALKPLAKCLGRVRDLDVLLETLRDRYHPNLPAKEQKVLDRILVKLQKKRDRNFKRMVRFLKGTEYATLKQTVRAWIKHPPANPTADLSIGLALPDLLLPVLSQTLLHPGWLATPILPPLSPKTIQANTKKSKTQKSRNDASGKGQSSIASAVLNNWLDHEGTILHDLRKQMKQLRYQADFFAPHYDATYADSIQEFKAIQDLLGTLQDYWVLSQTFTTVQGESWAESLPSLTKQIHSDRWDLWQQWEPFRHCYLTEGKRAALRQVMLSPTI